MAVHSVGQLYATLLDGVAIERPADALRFLINGKEVGLIRPASLPFFSSLPDVYRAWFNLTADTVALTSPASALNERLALLAGHWHNAGAFFQWRNELLDVVTLDGERLGHAERGLFRFLGMTTSCVHAVGIRDNRYFMGLRSRHKAILPSLWDSLAGGLVSAGESDETALAREILEEAGLAPEDYVIGAPDTIWVDRPVQEGWMRERSVTYPVHIRPHAVAHNVDGEVERIECVDKAVLLERIAQHQVTVEASLSFLSVLLEDTRIQSELSPL